MNLIETAQSVPLCEADEVDNQPERIEKNVIVPVALVEPTTGFSKSMYVWQVDLTWILSVG